MLSPLSAILNTGKCNLNIKFQFLKKGIRREKEKNKKLKELEVLKRVYIPQNGQK